MEKDQEFLEFVVKALVDHPEDVKVTRTVDELGVLLTLDVHRDDMGKIIGRAGNTAKAIRSLLRVVGMHHDARTNLKINEPEGGVPRGAAATVAGAGAVAGAAQATNQTDHADESAQQDDEQKNEESANEQSAGENTASHHDDMSDEDKTAASKSVDEAMEDLGL